MHPTTKNFCFATLAIGKIYRELAQKLALGLEKFSPGTKLIILTDKPRDFNHNSNILIFKHVQQSPLFPYNDKRWVLEKALQEFPTVVYVDADAQIVDYFPNDINWPPGIVIDHDTQRRFLAVVKKHCPQDLHLFEKVSHKIGLKDSLETILFPTQSLYVITRDDGKEQEFLRNWDLIARYLQVHRCSTASDGYAMGLAIARVGWIPRLKREFNLNQIIKTKGSRKTTRPQTFWQKRILNLLYHYRLAKIRLKALRYFDFFYGYKINNFK